MSMHEEKLTVVNTSIGVGGMTLYGLTLNDWVAIVTITYLVLQIILLIPKYVREFKAWKFKKEAISNDD